MGLLRDITFPLRTIVAFGNTCVCHGVGHGLIPSRSSLSTVRELAVACGAPLMEMLVLLAAVVAPFHLLHTFATTERFATIATTTNDGQIATTETFATVVLVAKCLIMVWLERLNCVVAWWRFRGKGNPTLAVARSEESKVALRASCGFDVVSGSTPVTPCTLTVSTWCCVGWAEGWPYLNVLTVL